MNEHEQEQANRLGRAWDAFVSGTEPREIAPDMLDQIQVAREVLAVPNAAPATRDAIWRQVSGQSLPAAISTAAVGASPNGVAARHDPLPVAPPASRPGERWLTIWRIVAIGAFAGFAAGFVAGIWTRLAMRVSGFLTIDRNRYLLTEAEARVGEITFGGTMFLAIFAAFTGIFGGLLYVGIRRWLPSQPLLRAVSYGVLLLAVFGFILMDENNSDYQLFGPAWLNVATFSLTYIVFGVLASLVAEWLDARVGVFSLRRSATRRSRLATLILTPFGGLGLVTVAVIAASGIAIEAVRIMVLLAALAIAFTLISRLSRWPWLHTAAVARLGIATALIPACIGVYLTTQGIVGILTG